MLTHAFGQAEMGQHPAIGLGRNTSNRPRKVLHSQASKPPAEEAGIGFTVVNFNTSTCTLRCVASLAAAHCPPRWILVLDNGSDLADYNALLAGINKQHACELIVYRSDTNLGFAAGSNVLVDELLRLPSCSHIGLLNNDAVAQPCLLVALRDALLADPAHHGMAGGRMHKLADATQTDTLGISVYASLMPADRHSSTDTYLGPTGGCCLITVECARDLIASTGHFFDPRYFCYCEDTDLVLRANLLGYRPAYTDTLVALHEGQASSSGVSNKDFIAYHGWRNVIWMHVKLLPARTLWRHAFWLTLAHLLWSGRHLLTGNVSLPWRVYRDAWRGWPGLWQERKRLKPIWRISPSELEKRLHPRFYRAGYITDLLRSMLTRSKVG